MNKEYTYIDGKAIIRDEKGKQKPIEYYDNLDKVLVQENLIETMEDRISSLEKKSNSYKNIKKHFVPFASLTSIFGIIAGVVLLSILDSNLSMYYIDSIFGTVNFPVFIASIISCLTLPCMAFLDFQIYREYKGAIKEAKGINSELEYLKKQIVIEKEHLDELQKDKKRDEENKDFRVVEVNDKQQLDILKSNLNLYYDLGYNDEKYYKYYEQGILDEKLSKNYNDDSIDAAKEYLEEKSPTLIKNKKNRKH